MPLTKRCLAVALLIAVLASSSATPAQSKRDALEKRADAADLPSVLWREPADIRARNLFYGPGGEAGRPKGKFTFVGEDTHGSNPKF